MMFNFLIFFLSPPPTVSWRRVGHGSMDDVRMTETSHKHEFTIKNVQPEDAGVYECSGRNIVVEQPVKQNFTLIVKCNITFSCPFPFFKQKNHFI